MRIGSDTSAGLRGFSSDSPDCVAQRRDTEGRGHNTPNPACYLSDTDILRASERQHPVQGSGSDSNIGRLGPGGARSKGIVDYTFVSPDRRLNLGPQIVAAGFLPDHAAAFSDHSQVAVALCRSGLG
jgi:hypothetical protein